MQFTDNESNHNIKTLEKFCKVFAKAAIDELEETYQWIASHGVRPQDNMGWLIQNFKKKIENADTTSDAVTTKIKGIADQFSYNKIAICLFLFL